MNVGIGKGNLRRYQLLANREQMLTLSRARYCYKAERLA
jgi:hypothetical protein